MPPTRRPISRSRPNTSAASEGVGQGSIDVEFVGYSAKRRNDEVICRRTNPSSFPPPKGETLNAGHSEEIPMLNVRRIIAALAIIAVGCGALAAPVRAGDPIKVGFSMALTGSVAQNGKQLIMALELWRDDINASGGLLGRPVELVYYDDQ